MTRYPHQTQESLFLPPMNANQRKSVEIGPLSAMLPGPLGPAFLDRLLQLKFP